MSEQKRTGNPTDDPAIARLYREAAREEPPVRLDAAILAAAHLNVGARPRLLRSAWLHSWRLPVSIAAVVALSVSLVTLVLDEGGDQLTAPPPRTPDSLANSSVKQDGASLPATPVETIPPVTRLAPDTGAVGTRQGAQEGQPAEKTIAKKAKRAEAVEASRAGAQPFPTAPPSPTVELRAAESGAASPRDDGRQPPAAVPDSLAPAGKSAADLARVPAVGEETPRAAAPAPPMRSRAAPEVATSAVRPAPQKSALIREYQNQTPEKWLEKIAELRRDAKMAEADEMLAEFKKRFPQHPLPAALR